MYSTPNAVRMIRLRRYKLVGHAVRTEEICTLSSLKGKRPLGKPHHRWNDNIKWILRK